VEVTAVGSAVAVAGAVVGVGGWGVGEGGAFVELGAGRMVAVALASRSTCTPASDPWLEEPEQAARSAAPRAARISKAPAAGRHRRALKAQET
jgi:hypothetical protein